MKLEDHHVKEIKLLLSIETGIDFNAYKNTTISRRIARRIQELKIEEPLDYIAYLKKHEKELEILSQDIFINVTSFFRDALVFQQIKEGVLPKIFKNKKSGDLVKFWVAGCATGEEAYSLTILIEEYCEARNVDCQIKIIATDIKKNAIEYARIGLYSLESLNKVNKEYKEKYFNEEKGAFRVKKFLRTKVVFALHDMIKDPPFAKMDFVSCRNLLIYLEVENQFDVLNSLVFSLNIGGFMVLGQSESAINFSEELRSVSRSHKIYQKIKKSKIRRLIRTGIPHQAETYIPIEISNEKNPLAMKNNGLSEALEKVIYGRYIPALVIIDEKFRIKYITTKAREYVDMPEDFTKVYSFIKFAPQQIVAVVRSALIDIQNKPAAYSYDSIAVGEEIKQLLTVVVEPIVLNNTEDVLYSIVFRKEEEKQDVIKTKETINQINLALERQLTITEGNLQETIEQLEISNQNLLASNEELQSTNEEYVSVNEELQVINAEYQENITELSHTNKDIRHLLESTDIATIFLDQKLQIRKFTDAVKDIVNIDEVDIGRPLKNFTTELLNVDLLEQIEIVLDKEHLIEKEVQDKAGKWFLMRINLYQIDEVGNKGLVISFLNINELKKVEVELKKSGLLYRSLFDKNMDGVIIFDVQQNKVLSANKRMAELLECPEKYLLEMTPADFFPEFQENGESTETYYAKQIEIVMRDKEHRHFIQLLSKKGKLIEIETTTFVLYDTPDSPIVVILRDITDQKNADRKLEKHEHYLRTIIDLSPTFIFSKNRAGKFLLANKAIAEIYGTQVENLEGKTDADFNPNQEEVAFYLKKDNEVMDKGEAVQIPIEMITDSKGKRHYLQTTKIPVFNEQGEAVEILGIATDITQLKEIEETLRESETRFKAVFDNSYNLIGLLDKAGKLLQQNIADHELKDDENIGKPIWNVYRFSHDKKVIAQIKRDVQIAVKGTEVRNECTYRKQGNAIGYLAYSLKPIYLEHGELLFILAEARDITELMESQNKLSNKNNELNSKNNELEKYIESNLALENFAYIASHDLREPLRTITSFANILEQKYVEKLDDNAKEYLDFIVSAAKNMDAFIKDLLTFSKVNSDETPYAEVSLPLLLERLLLVLGQSVKETNTTVELKGIPKTIWANNTQITQLFQNLISNAIKFRQADVVPKILIKGKNKKTHWEFMVKDNGIGINKEFHDKIFMLFKRLHAKGEYEGTGIGLSLCKSIIKRHGGEMWLKSEEGKGTTFYFTLAKR